MSIQLVIDKRRDSDTMASNNFQDIKILTVDEVAGILRVHRTTVTRLAKSGELKSHKIGTRRMFKDVDVFSFFENQADRECVVRKGN